MSVTGINITPFDNEISILYKWAVALGQPVKYLLVTPRESLDNLKTAEQSPQNLTKTISAIQVEPLLPLVQQLMQENFSLLEISDQLANYNHHFFLDSKIEEDLPIIYFHYAFESNPEIINQSNPPIIDEINSYYQSLELNSHLTDLNELITIHNSWFTQYSNLYKSDTLRLKELEDLQAALELYQPLPMSPLLINYVDVYTRTTLNDNTPNPDDGIDIFNLTEANEYVPYVQYNSTNQQFYKLYTGKNTESAPNYSFIILSSTKTNKPNNIYLNVWSGTGDSKKATKESYIRAVFNLVDNKLFIGSPINEQMNESVMIQRVESALPIKTGTTVEVKVSGEFNIYNIEINDTILVDLILNEDLMNAYLYVDETIKPYSEKKRLTIHFKSLTEQSYEDTSESTTHSGYVSNSSSVSATITQLYTQENQLLDVITDNVVQKITFPTRTPYIHINISKTESRLIAQQFAAILNRLLSFYLDTISSTDSNSILNQYQFYLPSFVLPSTNIEQPSTSIIKTPKRSKINRLKEVAPDLFVNGYARRCQCKVQPEAIDPSEISAWQQKVFYDNGVPVARQVMSFPRENPKWYFVCPDDATPYPGVKRNKDLPNRDIYPFIPCCFKDNQMHPDANTNYNEYYRDRTKISKSTNKAGHQIRTDRILQPGRTGTLPSSIKTLLTHYSPSAKNFVRYGIPHSVNSLIHCICLAIDYPDYLQLSSDLDRENFVIRLRQHAVDTINPSLLKQELYDFSESQIISQLADPSYFLDPSLYYRVFEILFNINIYVFTLVLFDTESETDGALDIPRHKLFYSRPLRDDRQTIIILKHWGTDSDNVQYPHCELIIDLDNTTNSMVKLFGSDMTSILHTAFLNINVTFSWSVSSDLSVITRENLFSLIDFYSLTRRSATSQYLDQYGKLRALIFPSQDEFITMICPPSQPENLPIFTSPSLPSFTTLLSTFPNPVAVTRNDSSLVTGFWFQVMDLTYGIYCPIIPIPGFEELPLGPPDPLFAKDVRVVPRLRKMRRVINIILQLLLWFYLLSSLPLDQFAALYLTVGSIPDSTDSSTIYDFSNLNRRLPQVSSVDEAIQYLSQTIPSFFLDNKIFIYNQKFYDGLLYYLRTFNQTNSGLSITLSSLINGLFESSSDFTPRPYNTIFVGESDLRSWLLSIRRSSYHTIIIKNRLDISFGLLDEPYLYITPDERIFLIQNVLNGDFSRAINVAYNWSSSKINLGFYSPIYVNPHPSTEQDEHTPPPYYVFAISTAGTHILLQDHSNNDPSSISLLTYTNNQYAALLPLL